MNRLRCYGDIEAGQRTVTWNGRDRAGRNVASGVYFFRLDTPVGTLTRKTVLLR